MRMGRLEHERARKAHKRQALRARKLLEGRGLNWTFCERDQMRRTVIRREQRVWGDRAGKSG